MIKKLQSFGKLLYYSYEELIQSSTERFWIIERLFGKDALSLLAKKVYETLWYAIACF